MGKFGFCFVNYIYCICLLLMTITIDCAKGIVEKNKIIKKPHYWRSNIQYKTFYFQQQVDHFNFANQDVYKQRYLVADQFWDREAGPIFFYTGNEGDIAWFCNNTGLMWDWAPEFKALLVFAEHRYYGESMPYGKESYQDLTKLGYLSSEQALADFTTLIKHIKSTVHGAANKPVIAFGGSYGGMLAAWFRIKYPHVVQGSLAGSAPIWMFGDLVPCEAFYQTVTKDFTRESETCAQNIRNSWQVINDMGKNDDGRRYLEREFGLCKPLKSSDMVAFKSWLSETFVNLAMVDYPYEANFLEPLPAWPIKAACVPLSAPSLLGRALMAGVAAAVKVYYNHTGAAPCLSIQQQGTKDLGDQGWDFQACTEMVMPLCTDGVHDMFEPSPWDYDKYSADCQQQFGVTPRPQWVLEQYGGRNITTATNIIFSNGDLDPWRVGGVLESLSPSLVAIRVPDGAHHLDLRGSTPHDPASVIEVRAQEKQIVQGWLQQYKNNKVDGSALSTSKAYWSLELPGNDVRLPDMEGLGDMAVIVGTLLFALGAGILLFYLGLAQNIRRHLTMKRKPPTYSEIYKVPPQEAQLI